MNAAAHLPVTGNHNVAAVLFEPLQPGPIVILGINGRVIIPRRNELVPAQESLLRKSLKDNNYRWSDMLVECDLHAACFTGRSENSKSTASCTTSIETWYHDATFA